MSEFRERPPRPCCGRAAAGHGLPRRSSSDATRVRLCSTYELAWLSLSIFSSPSPNNTPAAASSSRRDTVRVTFRSLCGLHPHDFRTVLPPLAHTLAALPTRPHWSRNRLVDIIDELNSICASSSDVLSKAPCSSDTAILRAALKVLHTCHAVSLLVQAQA